MDSEYVRVRMSPTSTCGRFRTMSPTLNLSLWPSLSWTVITRVSWFSATTVTLSVIVRESSTDGSFLLSADELAQPAAATAKAIRGRATACIV